MADSPERLLAIGAFSRKSRLSMKALRLYDEMGLLKPAAVDRSSGYRYYDESQVGVARLIALLRRLEMPLAQIAEAVQLEPIALIKSIGSYWQGVEADLRTKRELVRYLTAFLSERGEQMFDIETREVPEQQVATLERKVLVAELPGFIDEAMGKVYDVLGQEGVPTGVPFVIYHGEVNTDSDGPVEVCVPFEGGVKPVGQIRLRMEPAHQEVFTRITKSQVAFPGILEAYVAVEQWASDRSLSPVGSPREIYFADWNAASDDDPACDVALPVAG
jgi:DNA-binding transcriptional MerR regulator